MAESKQQEPSIEEILSSIRQIISEDQKTDTDASDLTLKGEVEEKYTSDLTLKGEAEEKYSSNLTLTGESDPFDKSVPIDLTQEVTEDDFQGETMASNDDIDSILNAPIIAPGADRIDLQEPIISEPIISEQTASMAESSMVKLAQNVAVFQNEPDRIASPVGPTLEEITRALLKPMLKQWLDTNLPPLVERLVQKEIEKITQKLK